MADLLMLLIRALASLFRRRTALVVENLLLRQQLQVALRPKRRLRLSRQDRLFWVIVRRLHPDWRRACRSMLRGLHHSYEWAA